MRDSDISATKGKNGVKCWRIDRAWRTGQLGRLGRFGGLDSFGGFGGLVSWGRLGGLIGLGQACPSEGTMAAPLIQEFPHNKKQSVPL